jgi:hypothetical protein
MDDKRGISDVGRQERNKSMTKEGYQMTTERTEVKDDSTDMSMTRGWTEVRG